MISEESSSIIDLFIRWVISLNDGNGLYCLFEHLICEIVNEWWDSVVMNSAEITANERNCVGSFYCVFVVRVSSCCLNVVSFDCIDILMMQKTY